MRKEFYSLLGHDKCVLNIVCVTAGAVERSLKAHDHARLKGSRLLWRNERSLLAGYITADGVAKVSTDIL
mgnify:CR=1 FL=1